jgi:hypothetical protein
MNENECIHGNWKDQCPECQQASIVDKLQAEIDEAVWLITHSSSTIEDNGEWADRAAAFLAKHKEKE